MTGPAEPRWWTTRNGSVAAQFEALQAARTPDPRPLAPVIALDGVRVEKHLKAIRIMLREAV